jgi:exosortase/archaeosortase family protein
MDKKLSRHIAFFKPYKGVLLFLFLLFFFHFSWKIAIDGDIEGDIMYLFGKDVTPGWFHSACRWLTAAATWFIRLFPDTQNLVVKDTIMYFPNGGIRISIIWGCTGIKQMFIFAGIMLFYRGPFLKKLWYIPMGCVILSIYNVIRIGLTVILTNGHPERFESLHDGIMRYIYYGIVFLLWVIWEELIVNKNKSFSWKEIGQIFKR